MLFRSIGMGKTARRAYGFDEVAIVPSRRTRDPEDVSIAWEIDAFTFRLPMLASAMDAATSPATAVEVGRLGGLAVLNLEGLFTRYEDPEPIFEEIAELPDEKATRRMQELYAEPMKDELVVRRIREIKEGGVVAAASLTPQRVERYAPLVLQAGLDILVIQGTVVSAEHVSTRTEPLDLKRFIRDFELPVIVGGCASYQTALHLMRTGAIGVLVGVGPGNACTTRGVIGVGVPQATAIAVEAGDVSTAAGALTLTGDTGSSFAGNYSGVTITKASSVSTVGGALKGSRVVRLKRGVGTRFRRNLNTPASATTRPFSAMTSRRLVPGASPVEVMNVAVAPPGNSK